jgi:thiol-disulfide isomerase/thioredoxin
MDSREHRTFTWFLIAACLALAVVAILLAWQNRGLKAELAATAMKLPVEAMAEGDSLEPLALLDEAGDPVALDFGEEEARTLLLVFSPECPACEEILPIWSSVLQDVPDSVRVVGIRLGTMTTAKTPMLAFQAYSLETSGLVRRIPYVPATFLLSRHGLVEHASYGVLTARDAEALRAKLGASGRVSG